jgi:RNA polymerase sigma factor (TIGR02999 family)
MLPASAARVVLPGVGRRAMLDSSRTFKSVRLSRIEPFPSLETPARPIELAQGGVAETFPLVYDELRRVAHRHLEREAEGHTLSTTALVHEAYLRLCSQGDGAFNDRVHFFAIAARAMRRILVDHARHHHAAKRGDGPRRVPLESIEGLAIAERAGLLVALDDALVQLASLDARQAKVVELRFFGGLTEEETAQALGIGLRTAKGDWAKARSWLYQSLYPDAVG